MNVQEILDGLGLSGLNAGTWCGDGGWLEDPAAPLIDSINPATGEVARRVQFRQTVPCSGSRPRRLRAC